MGHQSGSNTFCSWFILKAFQQMGLTKALIVKQMQKKFYQHS